MDRSVVASLTREQLAALIDVLPQAIFVKNADSVLVHVNKSCAEMWGMDAASLIGTTGLDHFPAEQVAAFLAKDREIFASGVIQQFTETFWSAKRQCNRIGRTTKIPIIDNDGVPQLLFGLTEDITETTESQRALRVSENSYHELMRRLPVGIVVHGLQGEILSANHRALELLGLTEEQLLGKTSMDPFWRVVDSQGVPMQASSHPAMRALTTCQPVGETLMGVERPDDKGRVWLQVQAFPVMLEAETLSHVVAVFSDVTSLHLARQDSDSQRVILDEQTTHVNAVLDNMADGVITIDDTGRIQSINQAACRMFGYDQKELLRTSVNTLMPMPHRSQHDGYLEHYKRTGEARVVGIPREVHGQRKDGRMFPMSLAVSKVERGDSIVFVGIVRDITQRLHDEEEIRRLAFFDTLTGLPNRRLLHDRLRQAMITSTRGHHHGALMFLDLDHFKDVNDAMGHEVGDELLKLAAQRLMLCVREGDTVARLGGDEFVLLLEALSTDSREAATQAEMVASKVLQALRQPYPLQNRIIESSVSIGITTFMEDHETMDELLKNADVAMYQAKSAGRNTIRFLDPDMQAIAVERSALERDMRAGLEDQQFVLYYQVQTDQHGNPSGAEALVRWNHPTRGMVSPAEFIPLAEDTGLILPLGSRVLRLACEQVVAWSAQPQTARWTVAVNVSALQMAQKNFVEDVKSVLVETGVDPRLIKLELTESMLANDVAAVIEKMHALRSLGVTFSLDDFGTGYSSLAYLRKLPIGQLKIDQSFVRDIETDPNDAVIAGTIVSLGHSLGLKVIAEGVETAAQRDFLIAKGCDAFQGYLFGRPQPAEALTASVLND